MKCKLLFLMCSTILLSACEPSNNSSSENVSDKSMTAKLSGASITEKPKNVVLILIDDLSHYGVTAYGANRLHSYDGEFTNKEFSTPNIDDLANLEYKFLPYLIN